MFILDKYFDIYYAYQNNLLYFTPKLKYTTYEFEKLFNFKFNCADYDANKIIEIILN